MGSHVRRFTLFAHNNDSDTFSVNLALKMARKTHALRIKIKFQIQMKVTVVIKGRLTLDSKRDFYHLSINIYNCNKIHTFHILADRNRGERL